MKARIIVSVVLVAVLASLVGSVGAFIIRLRSRPKPKPANRLTPTVLAPKIRYEENFRLEITAYGSARPVVRLRIAPQVSGRIVARSESLASGMCVTKGQELFRIERTDYELALSPARQRVSILEAQLARIDQEQRNLKALASIDKKRVDLATRELVNTRRLQKKNAAGNTEVIQAEQTELLRMAGYRVILNQLALIDPRRRQSQAELADAKARLEQARTDLKRTIYISPVTGRVISCSIEAGELVRSGDVCGELYATGVMELSLSIPADDLRWFDAPPANRTEAVVEWDSGARKLTWPAVLDRVESGLEAQTRMAAVVVKVNNPPVGLMLDINMFCRVTVLARQIERAIFIPRAAVQPGGTVWLANGGVLSERSVKVARFADEQAMILPGGGIEEGDRVVLDYVPRLVRGAAVTPIDMRGPPATAN